MKLRRCLLTVLATVLLALAGCGSSSSSSSPSGAAASPGASTTTTIEHAKAKFALHAGLAFGAFHRWIYKPARAGTLTHPLAHKLTAVKAGLAAGFVYHELKLALTDAQADPTLSKLVAPITALENRIRGVSSGAASPGTAESLNGAVSSIKQQSSAAGQPITEQAPASPGG